MATKTINVRQKQKYDTSTNWTTNNPILLAGEIGIESDTQKIKIGNGNDNWNTLSYISGTDGTKVKVDDNIVSEWNSNTKLDKVETDDGLVKAYVKKGDGTQDMRRMSSGVDGSTIVLRDINGKIRAGTPTEEDDGNFATNKRYVDNEVQNVKISEKILENTTPLTINGWGNASLVFENLDMTATDKIVSVVLTHTDNNNGIGIMNWSFNGTTLNVYLFNYTANTITTDTLSFTIYYKK